MAYQARADQSEFTPTPHWQPGGQMPTQMPTEDQMTQSHNRMMGNRHGMERFPRLKGDKNKGGM